MFQRLISIIWLFMFAMVLPTQAFGYLLQAESEVSARLNSGTNAQTLYTHQAVQALFDKVKQQPESEPVTQSEVSQDWLAIIHGHRWLNGNRHFAEGESSSNGDLPNVESAAVPLYHLYNKLPRVEQYLAQAARYPSSYRISGWKESNALYVALNSQFTPIC